MSDGIGRPIVEAGKKLELLDRDLLGGDAELMIEFTDSGVLGPIDSTICDVRRSVDLIGAHAVEGVGAACICPNVWEGNLRAGTLL